MKCVNKFRVNYHLKHDNLLFQDFASLYSATAWETSAKDATNINQVFRQMSLDLIEQFDQLQSLQSGPESLTLHNFAERSRQVSYICCWNS